MTTPRDWHKHSWIGGCITALIFYANKQKDEATRICVEITDLMEHDTDDASPGLPPHLRPGPFVPYGQEKPPPIHYAPEDES